jgi:Predicted pPIWI-associating nuclease
MGSQEAHSKDQVVAAVKDADLTAFDAWSDLDVLSSRTQIDAIEVDPAGISISNDGFHGVANVYVVLEYGGGEDDDGFTTSDAFLGKFAGHFDNGNPVLEKFTVDTSPFYAGEEAAAAH